MVFVLLLQQYSFFCISSVRKKRSSTAVIALETTFFSLLSRINIIPLIFCNGWRKTNLPSTRLSSFFYASKCCLRTSNRARGSCPVATSGPKWSPTEKNKKTFLTILELIWYYRSVKMKRSPFTQYRLCRQQWNTEDISRAPADKTTLGVSFVKIKNTNILWL